MIVNVDKGLVNQFENVNKLIIRKNYIISLLKLSNENKNENELDDEIQKRKLEIYKKHDIDIEEMKKIKHVSGNFTISEIVISCLNKSIGNNDIYNKINTLYKEFITNIKQMDWKYNHTKVNVPQDSYIYILNDNAEKRKAFSSKCGNIHFMIKDCGDNKYVNQFKDNNAIDGYDNILKVNEKNPIGKATNVYLHKEIQNFFSSPNYYIKHQELKSGQFELFVFYVPRIKELMKKNKQKLFAKKNIGLYKIIEFMDKYCEHSRPTTEAEYEFYQYETAILKAKLPDIIPIINN